LTQFLVNFFIFDILTCVINHVLAFLIVLTSVNFKIWIQT